MGIKRCVFSKEVKFILKTKLLPKLFAYKNKKTAR